MSDRFQIETDINGKPIMPEAALKSLQENGVLPQEKPQAEPERPSWLPEKFKTPEDLAKGYAELEKRSTQLAQEKSELAKKQEESSKAAEQAAESAGLDMATIQAEYQEKGELSEDTYKAFEKVGITKQMISTYIAGQEALMTQQLANLYDQVGGEEQYSAMANWAASAMSPEEVQSYNDALNSPDMATVERAVLALFAKYTKARGKAPTNMIDGSAANSSDIFRSKAEWLAAMRDPRFNKDTYYRQQVTDKATRSNLV